MFSLFFVCLFVSIVCLLVLIEEISNSIVTGGRMVIVGFFVTATVWLGVYNFA